MPTGVYERTERHRGINRKHGSCAGAHRHLRTPEYTAWRTMKARCYNSHNQDYENYGGRGISVCDRWRDDYAAFLADMGPKPTPRHSLDRRDSNGNYEPLNCRWATATEQVRGRRKTIFATVDGERLALVQWADRIGVAYSTLYARLRLHTPEEAIRMGKPNEAEIA